MLINTVPDDCLKYIGSNFIFNITSIVNLFMLSIEKKMLTIKTLEQGVKYVQS